jgi:hypothetical protein
MGVLSILAGMRKTAVCVQKELAEIATACADAAKALDEGKADSVPLHEITIPSEGWEKDNSGNYRLNMDIPGLTDEDTVNVLIDPHELGAKEEDLVETQSSTDTLTLIAKAVPTAALKAYYYKVKGDILVAVGSVVLPGKKYTLPAATTTTLGGVKVGSGLKVAADGKLSADAQKYTLTAATTTALGGVKVGSGLKVTADGKLSADALAAYPVGSIYQSTNSTSPAALFGGTWEQIASERVLMGASSSHKAGTTVKAGLPNITGTANGGVLSVSTPQSNGAFGATHYDSSLSYLSGDVRRLSTYNRTFDASRSNPIYGASDTVQPAAYYVYIWHRVA